MRSLRMISVRLTQIGRQGRRERRSQAHATVAGLPDHELGWDPWVGAPLSHPCLGLGVGVGWLGTLYLPCVHQVVDGPPECFPLVWGEAIVLSSI